MEGISVRKEQILRAVVIEYVETAEPVGSQVLVERYRIGVGPATIRSEMAEMSERGLLEQPHTSAGRIPSDGGYKYFVEKLVQSEAAGMERPEMRGIVRADLDLETLLQETCKVITRLTRYASIATTLNESAATVKQITLTGVTPTRAIMLIVLSNGDVHDQVVEATPDITLSQLHLISERLTAAVHGKPLRVVGRLHTPDSSDLEPSVSQLAQRSWKSFKSAAKNLSSGKLIREGTQYLLGEPEFQKDIAALGQLVDAIEDADTMHQVLDRSDKPRTMVSIGKENEPEPLKRAAIIASRFFVKGEEAGAIAVIGPTRMRYEETIPVVDQTARALSDALTRLMS